LVSPAICQGTNINQEIYPLQTHPVLSFSFGGIQAKVGSSQNISIAGDIDNYDYNASHSNTNKFILGTFIGIENVLKNNFIAQLGLSFYYLPDNFTSGPGVLTQGIDAQSSDAYNYTYEIKNRQLMLEGKLLKKLKQSYYPYVSFGFGSSFNQTINYQTTVPSTLTFTPQFSSNKNISFAYKVGAGVDWQIQDFWRLGIGYRFADLGKANLGSGAIDTTPFLQTLMQSHLYTQEVLVQLTFMFA
jgi:opacity protein-like surface antigen